MDTKLFLSYNRHLGRVLSVLEGRGGGVTDLLTKASKIWLVGNSDYTLKIS